MAKTDIKALALAPMAGFRTKEIPVPEWNGAKVVVREPSAEAWIRWQDASKTENTETETVAEKVRRNLRSDTALFISVLLDTDMQQVFTYEESEQVEANYGPVHSRLLKQALALITEADDAKAK